jgi:transposase InsO family protein
MQVFMSGHYQKWKANSRIAARPQIAKRRSAGPLSGAGGFARRRTSYHVPAAHKGGAAEQAIADMPFPDPPVRAAAQPTADQWHPRALVWIMRYEFHACYDLPAPSKPSVQYSKSLQQLYNQCRPHGALAGQTPASYLKER